MPEREQVQRHLAGAGGVRGRHRRDALVERLARVDDDEGEPGLVQGRQLRARLRRQDHDRAVGRAVHRPLSRLTSRSCSCWVGQMTAHVLLVQRLRKPGQEQREVARVDERQRDADEAGPAAGEAARAPVRAEALRPHDLQHGLARVLGDVEDGQLSTRETVAIDTPARSGDVADRRALPPWTGDRAAIGRIEAGGWNRFRTLLKTLRRTSLVIKSYRALDCGCMPV